MSTPDKKETEPLPDASHESVEALRNIWTLLFENVPKAENEFTVLYGGNFGSSISRHLFNSGLADGFMVSFGDEKE